MNQVATVNRSGIFLSLGGEGKGGRGGGVYLRKILQLDGARSLPNAA